MTMKKLFLLLFAFTCLLVTKVTAQQERAVWTKEKAAEWYSKQGWLAGGNYTTSSAINQLEMWQAATFDSATIDKELGWAANIGMNVMRVYLHDLAWKADAKGFKKRMDKFLSIAAKHKIKILFCIFDDCWNPDPVIGKQPEPKPGVHNSGDRTSVV